MTSNPIRSTGLFILFIAIIITVIGLLILLFILFRKNEKVRNALINLKKRIWLNFVIRYMLEHYLVLVIAFMLATYSLDFSSNYLSLQSYFYIAVFLMIIACPFLIWKFLYRKFDEDCMLNPMFHEKFGTLVLDLQHRKKEAMLFNVFYMFRRIGMAFILVILPNLNWLQR